MAVWPHWLKTQKKLLGGNDLRLACRRNQWPPHGPSEAQSLQRNISVTADHTTSPEYLKQAVSSFSNADHAEQIA